MIAAMIITNLKGKTEYVVTDSMKILTREEAIGLASSGKFKNLQVVRSKKGLYLRSKKNKTLKDNLDVASITTNQFWTAHNELSYRQEKSSLAQFEKVRNANMVIPDDAVIVPVWNKNASDYTDQKPTKSRKAVITFIEEHTQTISQSSNRQKIYAPLLGAILMDEYCRIGWEDFFDKAAAQMLSSFASFSIGIAQVKLKTARDLVQKNYYTPDTKINLADPKNSQALIKYLDSPTHSIHFSAAYIRQIIDRWKKYADLSKRPEIIGTIYSQGDKGAHSDPRPNLRGKFIKDTFYPLAQQLLV